MTTEITTTKGAHLVEIGDRLQLRIGGQDLQFTVGDIIEKGVGGADGRSVRSTSDADHVWTRMWMHLPERVCVVAVAATDDEMRGL